MQQPQMQTRFVGITTYTDLKNQSHTVTHSVLIPEAEKWELEEKIAEDVFQIFTHPQTYV